MRLKEIQGGRRKAGKGSSNMDRRENGRVQMWTGKGELKHGHEWESLNMDRNCV